MRQNYLDCALKKHAFITGGTFESSLYHVAKIPDLAFGYTDILNGFLRKATDGLGS